MTLGWSVCCYLHGLLPDQLFKHRLVIHSEVSGKKKKKKDYKTLRFLSISLTSLRRFLSGGHMIGVCVCGSSITSEFDWEAHIYLILIYFTPIANGS